MKRVVRAVFAAAMVAVGVMTAHADDDVRWVSPTGDDTKDGLTEATAWKTPQKAIDFFGTGAGTVRLTAGTFEGANPILNIASGAVKVIGAGRDLTVLKPDNTVAMSAVSVTKSGAVVSNLTVTGCSGAYAVSLQNGGGIVFCNVVSNKAGGVKFVPAATSSFCRNCSVSFNSNASGPSAVYHNSWGAAYLRNCLFIGNTTTKDKCGTVNADMGGALNVSFCTFVDNVGTATGGVCDNNNNTSVKNCIFRRNRGSADVLTYDFGGTYQHLISAVNCMSDQGGGTDPVSGDPAFASPAAVDYRLRLGSACRNAGVATSSEGVTDAADVDYYGQPRVSGSAPDLGCAELQEPTAATCDIDISNAFVHYAECLSFSPRFEQVAAGADYDCGWTLSTAGGTVLTNLFGAEQAAAFDVFGPHVLKLFATNCANRAEVLTATMPLDFGLPLTNYVAAVGGAGVWPYAHPETATTSFSDASDAVCQRGGVVRLLEGTYTGPQPLFTLDKDICILGSGDGKTILKPDNTKSDYTVKLQYPFAWLGGVTLTGNTKKRAVYLNKNAALQDSLVVSNSAGGVIFDGPCGDYTRMSRCTIAYNTSTDDGAGFYAYTWKSPTIDNCLFIGNKTSSASGGGLSIKDVGPVKVEYCTIVGNSAKKGGGLAASNGPHRLLNCIVKDNFCASSENTPDLDFAKSQADNLLISSCWTAAGLGVNPIVGDVAFKDALSGDFRLRTTSCCRDAGFDITGHDADKLDLEGKARVWGDAPDAGCYEFVQGAETTCDIAGLERDEIWKGAAVPLSAVVTPKTAGSTYTYAWQLIDANGQVVDTFDAPAYNCVVPGYGPYTLKLAVVNTDDPSDRADCTLSNAFVSKPLTNYVVVAAKGVDGAVPPYDSWATAATNIQDAVDAVCVGGTTILSEGVHLPRSTSFGIDLVRDVTIEGSGANASSIIKFNNCRRIIYVNSKNAVLRNVTLSGAIYTGWYTSSCLGIGPAGGTAEQCTFVNNKIGSGSSSSYIESDSARISRCRFVGNGKVDGQLLTVKAGMVDNCLFASNTCSRLGFVTLAGARSRLVNSTFVDNVATGAVRITAKPTANAMLNCILANTRRPDGSTGDEWTTSLTAASDLAALEAAVSNCCFATGTTLGANAVTGDPKFRNAARGDWRLQASSPCFDAGLATPEMEDMTDFAGNPRLKPEQGSRAHVDIGCLERGWPGGLLLMVR